MNLPNKLTVLRMVMIPFFVAFVLMDGIAHHFLWAALVFAAASFTDLLDGRIARKYHLVTDFGKFMDPLADKLLVVSALVCFVALDFTGPVVVIVILAREFLVTSLRLVAASKQIVIAADRWGKYKTVSQMVWVLFELLSGQAARSPLFSGYAVWSGFHWGLICLVLFLTLFSGANYLIRNRAVFSDR